MNNESLKQLALDVNRLLNEYLIIDKELIKRSTGFLSMFKSIPFDSFEKTLDDIIKRLSLKKQEIENLGIRNVSQVQKEFTETLLSYSTALIESVGFLHKKVFDLAEASKGSQGKKLSFADHSSNVKDYNESMNGYLQYGQKLNDLFDKLDG